jgi:hypothetical protein
LKPQEEQSVCLITGWLKFLDSSSWNMLFVCTSLKIRNAAGNFAALLVEKRSKYSKQTGTLCADPEAEHWQLRPCSF